MSSIIPSPPIGSASCATPPTRSAGFRRALHDLSLLLWSRPRAPCPPRPSRSPRRSSQRTDGSCRVEPLIAPVLRAGLGMLDAAQLLLPQAHVAMLGFRRDEASLEAERYLAAIPQDLEQRPVFVLDPMVATGGTVGRASTWSPNATVDPPWWSGCWPHPRAWPPSMRTASARRLVVASVDERLNEVGYIVPGPGRRRRPPVRVVLRWIGPPSSRSGRLPKVLLHDHLDGGLRPRR